ncbi:hypothetical protein [Woeseia oceani]|uniref:Uncharacterized protein n=1 Tax=Woeseia oceani TaxID=1548547 RepID=A0A193LEG3_9GAMM|nr:hypothetical protein [Woeseia oceani]ANO50853.1 hypothetical protein BA177_06200 [Woeseia oceani]
MTGRKFSRDNQHVFAPGGRRNAILDKWEACIRGGIPIVEPWSLQEIQAMLEASSGLNEEEELGTKHMERARRIWGLCRRALVRTNLDRASALMSALISSLGHEMTLEDIGEAQEARNLRQDQAATRQRGGQQSGKARKQYRQRDLDNAAHAYLRLHKNYTFRTHFRLSDIAKEAGLTLPRVTDLTKKAIVKRAEELN